MTERGGAASPDALKELLRGAGLRATSPRLAVLRVLRGASSPQSHGDLVARLGPEGWDRATIYRNLTDLTEAGLVRRADLGDHVWRFEARDEPEGHDEAKHPHFLCDDCGDVVCLPDDVIEIKPRRGVPRALRSAAVEVQLRGRCDRCA